MALVAINGALRTCDGNGAASTLGDLVGLTPRATYILHNNRRIAIPIDRIGINSLFLIHPNRDVPISNAIARNVSAIGRTTLANRDVPISGFPNSPIDTTAVGRGNTLAYHTRHINRSAALSRIVHLIHSTTTAGTPLTGATSEISNVFIPAIVYVTTTAFIV